MKTKLLSLVLLLACSVGATSRTPLITSEKKCSPEIRRFMMLYQEQGPAVASKSFNFQSAQELIPVTIFCSDYQQVAARLDAMGVSYHRVARSLLTAKVSPADIYTVAGIDAVRKVAGLDKHYLHLDNARTMTQAGDVQTGKDLETPFTGKGVTIGVIDQGFQYNHPAFRVSADSTRIVGVWNIAKGESPYTTSAAILNKAEDNITEAHGTHVAGIAAGGKTGSSTYYGIAPDAHLVVVSSYDFTTHDVVSGVSFVKEMAGKYGEPWVVNMSIGSNLCTHDGADDIELALDSIASDGRAIFVSSAGNEGEDTLHARYDFTDGNDTCLFVVQRSEDTQALRIIFAGTDATPFSVQPVYLNMSNGTYIAPTKKELQRNGNLFAEGVNEGRRYYSLALMPIRSDMSKLADTYQPAFVVKGKAGHSVHAFLNSGEGNSFVTSAKNVCAAPDALMSVGSPAGARSVIAVGAYASKKNWQSVDGKVYGYNSGSFQPLGTLAGFSSVGPMIDSTLLKPDVCAPGFGVVSAVKRVGDYADTDSWNVEKTTYDGVDYYYGVMQGTSQASPVVAGIVALWLQANPALTSNEVFDIIRTSSVTDEYTGAAWNYRWGYGKINAYRGLQLALQKVAGIDRIVKSETPVTIEKGPAEWKILFNSDEPSVGMQLCTADGRTVMLRTLTGVRAGDEQRIRLSEYPSGIYILRIQTPGSCSTRKVYVK